MVPAHFLNVGWVQVGVAISTYHPLHIHLFERDAVLIQVTEESPDEIRRGGFLGHIPGIVRPQLIWETVENG
jgi:lipopolysaccharide transport system ATP-binding protein